MPANDVIQTHQSCRTFSLLLNVCAIYHLQSSFLPYLLYDLNKY